MIGVCDSGIGGLTILKELQLALPNEQFCYVADSANAPYGSKSAEDIYTLTQNACQLLFDSGCEIIIVACNSAASCALRRLQQQWLPKVHPTKNILGVFVPVIEALTGSTWQVSHTQKNSPKRVAIFATPATVASKAFTREVTARAPEITVEEVACKELAANIENAASSSTLKKEIVGAVSCLKKQPEAALLACTHYPYVAPLFEAALPGVPFISQAQAVAEALMRYLEKYPRYKGAPGATRYLTTGEVELVVQAAAQFAGQVLPFEKVDEAKT